VFQGNERQAKGYKEEKKRKQEMRQEKINHDFLA
jgi:hypothetical protein